MCGEPPAPSRRAGELSGDGKHRWFCLAYFAPNRCRDQLPKRPVMQTHGVTLSFHREMTDSSRELVGPDITAAVSFESYPRFIKGGFQDYEGLGIKRSTAESKHVPSLRSRLLGNNVFGSLPQEVVECLEFTETSGDAGPRTSRPAFQSGAGLLAGDGSCARMTDPRILLRLR